jgi:hypothetical protein
MPRRFLWLFILNVKIFCLDLPPETFDYLRMPHQRAFDWPNFLSNPYPLPTPLPPPRDSFWWVHNWKSLINNISFLSLLFQRTYVYNKHSQIICIKTFYLKLKIFTKKWQLTKYISYKNLVSCSPSLNLWNSVVKF